MTVPFQIDRDPKNGSHGDILITVGSSQHRCDSYYFAIDESTTASESTNGGLARLLEQWLSDIASLGPERRRVYLPADLSDQCSAWLKVELLASGSVSVELGWSDIEGWSFVPSNYGSTGDKIAFLEPIAGARFEAPVNDVVAQIGASRDRLMTAEIDD